jgi:two-component system sensor histidine kinase UhpB
MKAENYTLLVVEDNPADAFLIEEMLCLSGMPPQNIFVAQRLTEALDVLSNRPVDVVLLDLSLPDSFGMESFRPIKERFPQIAVIILTGLSDSEVALQALQIGAQDYLVKGEINPGLLVKSIQYSMERKRAEENLLQSEEKYRQIFYKNPFPMWISDADNHRVLEVNDAAIKRYGYQKEEFLSLRLEEIQGKHTEPLLLPFADDTCRPLWRHYKKNGDLMLVECTSYPVPYAGRNAIQLQVHDVTDQVRLERELSLKNQQMIEAALNAQENERRVIGEELHDNINQILTAIKISLGFLLEQPEPNKELLGRCLKNSTQAIEEVRKLSRALILPSNLRELGLVASLEILMEDIESITTLDIILHTSGLEEYLLTEEQKTTLFRIVQEQMNNILKYSEATHVIIDLSSSEGKVRLCISDNGKGFNPAAKVKGVGFHNISNRAKLFNGSMKIDSSAGNGCRLFVTIYAKNAIQLEAV